MLKKLFGFTATNAEEQSVLLAGASVAGGCGCLTILGGILFFFATGSVFSAFDVAKTGTLGDAFNGLTAPFLAIVLAILTFLAFYVQYAFNKQQKKDIEYERFENRFFELLKLHKENTNEIQVVSLSDENRKYSGREVFTQMYYEYRLCYMLIEDFIKNFDTKKIGITAQQITIIQKEEGTDSPDFSIDEKEKITAIAYTIFFHGISRLSIYAAYPALHIYSNKRFLLYIISRVVNFSREYKGCKDVASRNALIFGIDKRLVENVPDYLLFQGHTSILGHYYRNLFQTVKFVDKFDPKIMQPSVKYEYVKILRAQLSTYEQIMLYYNSLSAFGSKWVTEGFMKNYRPIRNIPLPLTEFAYRPQDKFKKEIGELKAQGIAFFEWDEQRQTPTV